MCIRDRNKPGEHAKALKIPDWNDAAIREAVQGATGPFYLATAHVTKLDDIATETYHAAPDNIALLGYAVADVYKRQCNLWCPYAPKLVSYRWCSARPP